jgi:hypothetical protein
MVIWVATWMVSTWCAAQLMGEVLNRQKGPLYDVLPRSEYLPARYGWGHTASRTPIMTPGRRSVSSLGTATGKGVWRR